jgi:hypothetical protein
MKVAFDAYAGSKNMEAVELELAEHSKSMLSAFAVLSMEHV